MNRHLLMGAVLAILALAGCRGVESDNEPIHVAWNMDEVARYDPQEANDFFEDGRAMRQPAPGTVPRGFLKEDGLLYTGRTDDGNYVEEVPLPVTEALLKRGQARFNIYCTPCHGRSGDGQGIIMRGNYGYTPAPTYHKTALRDTADGYLFDVITNGVRNMPSYAQQVPVADRWAIVTYIRALQRSQNASRENVPPSVLARIEQTGSANMNAARNPASSSGGSGSSSSSGGSTDGGSASGAGTTSASSSSNSSDESAPPTSADTAATSNTAAAAGPAPADSAGSGVGSVDTSSSAGAPVQADAAGRADADSAGEGGAAAASTEGRSSASDENSGRGFFSSTFFILVLVVLPIMVLVTILITAFRKDREH